jgi:hypothetical protein
MSKFSKAQQLDQAKEINAKLEELLLKVSNGVLRGSDITGQYINAAEAINFIKESCCSNPTSIDKDKLVKELENQVVFLEHQLNNAIVELQRLGKR